MRLRDRHQFIARMQQRNLSVRELARWASCHPSMIGHLRTGVVSTCTPKLAARIEKALAVDPGTLFDAGSTAPSDPSNVPSSSGQTSA